MFRVRSNDCQLDLHAASQAPLQDDDMFPPVVHRPRALEGRPLCRPTCVRVLAFVSKACDIRHDDA